jgi:hypothetical protein
MKDRDRDREIYRDKKKDIDKEVDRILKLKEKEKQKEKEIKVTIIVIVRIIKIEIVKKDKQPIKKGKGIFKKIEKEKEKNKNKRKDGKNKEKGRENIDSMQVNIMKNHQKAIVIVINKNAMRMKIHMRRTVLFKNNKIKSMIGKNKLDRCLITILLLKSTEKEIGKLFNKAALVECWLKIA